MRDSVALMWINRIHVAWWGGLSSATSSLNGRKLTAGTKMKKIYFIGWKHTIIFYKD